MSGRFRFDRSSADSVTNTDQQTRGQQSLNCSSSTTQLIRFTWIPYCAAQLETPWHSTSRSPATAALGSQFRTTVRDRIPDRRRDRTDLRSLLPSLGRLENCYCAALSAVVPGRGASPPGPDSSKFLSSMLSQWRTDLSSKQASNVSPFSWSGRQERSATRALQWSVGRRQWGSEAPDWSHANWALTDVNIIF